MALLHRQVVLSLTQQSDAHSESSIAAPRMDLVRFYVRVRAVYGTLLRKLTNFPQAAERARAVGGPGGRSVGSKAWSACASRARSACPRDTAWSTSGRERPSARATVAADRPGCVQASVQTTARAVGIGRRRARPVTAAGERPHRVATAAMSGGRAASAARFGPT